MLSNPRPMFAAVALLLALAAAGSPARAEDDAKAPAFPTIKNHPLPDVAAFTGVATVARDLPRDPFLDASLRGERTLRQAVSIDVSAPSSYGETQFNQELLESSERRLSVSAILLGGGRDTAIINQRAFATGEQVPVRVETSEPTAFTKLAGERHIPCLNVGSVLSAKTLAAANRPGASKTASTICVFLEVGRISPDSVALRFPGGHTDVAMLRYNAVIRLEPDRATAAASR